MGSRGGTGSRLLRLHRRDELFRRCCGDAQSLVARGVHRPLRFIELPTSDVVSVEDVPREASWKWRLACREINLRNLGDLVIVGSSCGDFELLHRALGERLRHHRLRDRLWQRHVRELPAASASRDRVRLMGLIGGEKAWA